MLRATASRVTARVPNGTVRQILIMTMRPLPLLLARRCSNKLFVTSCAVSFWLAKSLRLRRSLKISLRVPAAATGTTPRQHFASIRRVCIFVKSNSRISVATKIQSSAGGRHLVVATLHPIHQSHKAHKPYDVVVPVLGLGLTDATQPRIKAVLDLGPQLN